MAHKLRFPPHLYSVTALPSKLYAYATANTDATFSNV